MELLLKFLECLKTKKRVGNHIYRRQDITSGLIRNLYETISNNVEILLVSETQYTENGYFRTYGI